MEGCDYMTVYIETGYDGKERKFVYGNGYYRKIYKQYKKSLNNFLFLNIIYSSNLTMEYEFHMFKYCHCCLLRLLFLT